MTSRFPPPLHLHFPSEQDGGTQKCSRLAQTYMVNDGCDFYRARLSPNTRFCFVLRQYNRSWLCQIPRAFSAVFSGSSWFAPEVETWDSSRARLALENPIKMVVSQIRPSAKTFQQLSKFDNPMSLNVWMRTPILFQYCLRIHGTWPVTSLFQPVMSNYVPSDAQSDNSTYFFQHTRRHVACSACSTFASSPLSQNG